MRYSKVLLLSGFLFLSGCYPEYVKLTPEQVTEITSQAGQLNAQNLDAWIEQTSKLLDAQVTDVTNSAKGVIVTLAPRGQDIATEAAKGVINNLPSLLTGGLGGLLSLAGVAGAKATKRAYSRSRLKTIKTENK